VGFLANAQSSLVARGPPPVLPGIDDDRTRLTLLVELVELVNGQTAA